MLKIFKLLLPILAPSWQFFREVTPSPRIEFKILNYESESEWQEFNKTPKKINSLEQILKIFYNSKWNEKMFLVNCAERLIINENDTFADKEIKTRIARKLYLEKLLTEGEKLEFRLVFIYRSGDEMKRKVLYQSVKEEISKESCFA